jgi:hypothetical protein
MTFHLPVFAPSDTPNTYCSCQGPHKHNTTKHYYPHFKRGEQVALVTRLSDNRSSTCYLKNSIMFQEALNVRLFLIQDAAQHKSYLCYENCSCIRNEKYILSSILYLIAALLNFFSKPDWKVIIYTYFLFQSVIYRDA